MKFQELSYYEHWRWINVLTLSLLLRQMLTCIEIKFKFQYTFLVKIVSEKYLIHLQALLPQNQTSFYYDGLLTTPPCTEEVKWIIFEQPIEMSKEQIQALQKKIFKDNHRPIQPLNEREIIKN